MRFTPLVISLAMFSLAANAETTSAGKEQCQAGGAVVASTWHKAAVCSSYYENMKTREEKLKKRIAATYPKLYRAFGNAPWSAIAKDIGENSIYADRREDPLFSEQVCQDPLDFLEKVVSDPDWKKKLKCWR